MVPPSVPRPTKGKPLEFGTPYEWQVPPKMPIPAVDVSLLIGESVLRLLLAPASTPTEEVDGDAYTNLLHVLPEDQEAWILKSIAETLPTKQGQRNRLLFELARRLVPSFHARHRMGI